MKKTLLFVLAMLILSCGLTWGSQYYRDNKGGGCSYEVEQTLSDPGDNATVCTSFGVRAAMGGGSGSMTTVKENNVQVGGADIVTLDFLGADFDLTESPDTEVQVVIAAAMARDSEVPLDSDFGTNGIMERTGAGTYGIVVDPSADIRAMLGSANDTAILNSIGDGIVTLSDTTLADADYLWFWDYSDNGTTKRVDADELRNVPASTTLAGEIAIATIGEVNTGTNATIAVTPDALAGSFYGRPDIGWTICDDDTNTTIANGRKGYCVPWATSLGVELISCTCAVADLNGATGGTTTVMLRRVRAGVSADMLSVAVTLSHNEYEAHDATIDVNNDDLARGDLLYFDIDAITSGHPHKGLSCTALVGIP